MKFVESIVAVICWIAFVAGPVVTCPAPAPAAIWEFVHVERSFNARKDEASEQNGSERHGYVDAEQNSVPECLRQNLYKQLRTTIKMLKNDKKTQLILKELISVAFQLRLRMSKMAGGFGACLPSSLFFGSGACLPSSLSFLSSGKGICSIMICWFVFVPAGVPVLVSLLLSSFFSQEKVFCFIMDFLVPLGSGWGSGACLPSSLSFLSSGKGFCSIMICWFVLVPAGFRCLSPFFSLLSFLRKGVLFHHGFPGASCFGLGFRCLSPFFSLFCSFIASYLYG